jgi:hypothetical protein
MTIVYDGDGNRVSETVGGTTTKYLVDDHNPTGYSQVMDELVNGSVTRTYAYGLNRISENQLVNGAWVPSFYGYDGHGNVRFLANASGESARQNRPLCLCFPSVKIDHSLRVCFTARSAKYTGHSNGLHLTYQLTAKNLASVTSFTFLTIYIPRTALVTVHCLRPGGSNQHAVVNVMITKEMQAEKSVALLCRILNVSLSLQKRIENVSQNVRLKPQRSLHPVVEQVSKRLMLRALPQSRRFKHSKMRIFR